MLQNDSFFAAKWNDSELLSIPISNSSRHQSLMRLPNPIIGVVRTQTIVGVATPNSIYQLLQNKTTSKWENKLITNSCGTIKAVTGYDNLRMIFALVLQSPQDGYRIAIVSELCLIITGMPTSATEMIIANLLFWLFHPIHQFSVDHTPINQGRMIERFAMGDISQLPLFDLFVVIENHTLILANSSYGDTNLTIIDLLTDMRLVYSLEEDSTIKALTAVSTELFVTTNTSVHRIKFTGRQKPVQIKYSALPTSLELSSLRKIVVCLQVIVH